MNRIEMNSKEDKGKESQSHHTSEDPRSNSPLNKENEHQPQTPKRPAIQHALSPFTSPNRMIGNRIINQGDSNGDSNGVLPSNDTNFNDKNALKRKTRE